MKTKPPFPSRGADGVSLIEIAIVVAVIGVVAMVALPNLFTSRSVSEATVCITNLKAIVTAKEAWAFENNKAMSDEPTYADLKPYLDKNQTESICPLGGKYTIGTMAESPSCEYKDQGHVLPQDASE